MKQIDWKRKLSSRKFWALLAGLLIAILGGVLSPEVVNQLAGVITAIGAVVVYILAEAKIDASYNAAHTSHSEEEDEED